MSQTNSSQVTIDQVAQYARVSISTVSRVLNGRDRVHPQTRERILAAIDELHYQPSAFARGLATQRTSTLGFVIPNISDQFFLDFVRGVEETATAAGYGLLITRQPSTTSDPRYLQLFTQRRVDGMILVGITMRRHEIEQIQQRGVPIALVLQDIGDTVPTFVVDNYGGACAVVEHILQHGRRRIAYITGDDYTPDNAERLRGLRNTLAAYGLSLSPERIAHGTYSRGSGYQPMLQLLGLPEPPDAVFAANDQMAADALIAIRERGLRVPEDIAVVGFDDVPLASYLSPPLTTVHQPLYELGVAAARAVINALEGASVPMRTVLPTKLIVRRSCGCTT